MLAYGDDQIMLCHGENYNEEVMHSFIICTKDRCIKRKFSNDVTSYQCIGCKYWLKNDTFIAYVEAEDYGPTSIRVF